MKILAIGDPHGKLPKNLTSIVRKEKPNLIVCTGDIPAVTFESSQIYAKASKKRRKQLNKHIDFSYKNIIKKLCSFNLPVIVLIGNVTWGRKNNQRSKLFAKYKNLIYRTAGAIKISGYNIVMGDIAYDKWHKSYAKRFLKYCRKIKPEIIISHAPPFGYVDKLSSNAKMTAMRKRIGAKKHGGVKSVLKAIKLCKPLLVLCSHIHEARGTANIGKTKVVNAGAHGHYAIIDIKNDKVNVKLK